MVVAPHPDDEILGVGGTVALLAGAGADVDLVAVTDGEAGGQRSSDELRRIRPLESERASAALGVRYRRVTRLGLADGGVGPGGLAVALRSHVAEAGMILAPWPHDGHPDHDAVGAAATALAAEAGVEVWHFPVWAWHWSDPGADDLPWSAALRVDLPPAVAERKVAATECFASQIVGSPPVLPAHVLAHLLRPFEILFAA